MERITNDKNIDPLIYQWMIHNQGQYTGGESLVTASQMYDPTQLIILKKRYGDRLVSDAMDGLWTTMGSLFHKMIEDLPGSAVNDAIKRDPSMQGLLQEQRFNTSIDGHIVSGQADVIYPKRKEAVDYKFTTAYSHTSKDTKNKYDYQLNTLGYLCGLSGIKIDMGVIVAVFRDWHASQALISEKQGRDYPSPEEQYEFPMWSEKDQKNMIYDKVKEIADNLNTPDGELPECTEQQMWADPSYYTVLTPKGDRAMTGTGASYGLNKKQAEAFCKSKNVPTSRIEFRQAVRKRCENYCPVKQFCHQYKTYKGGK